MAEDKAGEYGIAAGIGIVAVAAFQNSIFAIVSGVSGFAAEFSSYSTTAVQMIVTLPNLTALVVALIVGLFASGISTKTAVLTGIAINGISGAAVYWLESYTAIMASRVVFGVSLGIISPLCVSVVSEYYSGEKRAAMIGIKTAVQNAFAVAFGFLGGMLAANAWRMSYLLYLVALPIFFIVLFFMPKKPSIKSARAGEKIHLTRTAMYCCFYILLFWLFLQVFSTNSSMLVSAREFGDASDAGFGVSIYQIAGTISALSFSAAYKILRRFTLPVASAITAAGLMIIGGSNSLGAFYCGSALAGAGLSLCTPKLSLDMFSSLNSSSRTLGIGILMSFMYTGQFLSPLILNPISDGTPQSRFYIASAGLIAMTVIVGVQNVLHKYPESVEA
ncbi:MAG: MFS transporter [Synergistaceae bacterium]|nr:MFS transporter [Synergistaceae bacterium]